MSIQPCEKCGNELSHEYIPTGMIVDQRPIMARFNFYCDDCCNLRVIEKSCDLAWEKDTDELRGY